MPRHMYSGTISEKALALSSAEHHESLEAGSQWKGCGSKKKVELNFLLVGLRYKLFMDLNLAERSSRVCVCVCVCV